MQRQFPHVRGFHGHETAEQDIPARQGDPQPLIGDETVLRAVVPHVQDRLVRRGPAGQREILTRIAHQQRFPPPPQGCGPIQQVGEFPLPQQVLLAMRRRGHIPPDAQFHHAAAHGTQRTQQGRRAADAVARPVGTVRPEVCARPGRSVGQRPQRRLRARQFPEFNRPRFHPVGNHGRLRARQDTRKQRDQPRGATREHIGNRRGHGKRPARRVP